MKRWYDNYDAITPIFKFSPDVRKVIYTTNAIESLNSTYRKLNRQRSVFPSDTALLKALYLATFEATKKMDYEYSELGTGLRRTQHYVWGTTPRIKESICMMRRTFLTSALDMPEIMSYIIYSKSWKLQFSASSSIIIIEDYYLQTVLHSLEYWVLTIILDKTLYSSFCFLLNPKFCELHVGNKPQVHFLYHIFHLLFYWFSQKI